MVSARGPSTNLLIEGYTPKQLQSGTGGPSDVERLSTRAHVEAGSAGMESVLISEHDSEIYEGDRDEVAV